MKKIKFKYFKKKSGTLIPFSLKKSFPIKVKRIFIIDGKKNFTRGDHAHKNCSQFLFPILGKIKIQSISKNYNENSILVNPDDSNELANAIINLLENPKKCDDLGLAGFKLIHEICNSDVMSLNYLKIYQKILKNHI